MFPVLFENFISSAWTVNSKRSCCLVFLCQGIILLTILFIGFVYVHSYIPNYNNKRFPKSALVCTTVSDAVVEKCELTTAESRWDEIFHDEDDDRKSRSIKPQKIIVDERAAEEDKNFMWSSCGEFCSTEAAAKSGCRQLRVNVRLPGSDLNLDECKDIDVTECGDELQSKGFDKDDADVGHTALRSNPISVVNSRNMKFHQGLYKCEHTPQTDHSLRNLETINNCTSLEHIWRCAVPSDSKPENTFNCTSSPLLSSSQISCLEHPGFYICNSNETCVSVENPENICKRKCDMIENLEDKNLIITSDKGTLITAKCSKAMHSQKHFEMWPRGFKNKIKPELPPALFINCNDLNLPQKYFSQRDQGPFSIQGYDCVNGTLLEGRMLPAAVNLKDLMTMWHEAMGTEDYLLDPINQKYAPPEHNLSIYSEVPLYYTDFYYKSGCSMPPSFEECKGFYKAYGKVPDTLRRGQHLFPCFCRSTSKTTYCVAPNEKLLAKSWEENLVEFVINPYRILILIFLGVILGFAFIFMCALLYPLITDAIFNSQPSVLISKGGSAVVGSRVGSRRPSFQGRSRRPSVFLTPVSPLDNYINDVFATPRRESLFEKRS